MNEYTRITCVVSPLEGQCGASVVRCIRYLDSCNRAVTPSKPSSDKIWDEFLRIYKLRIHGQIIITDRVSSPSGYANLFFVKELLARKETVVVLPPSRNFNYPDHTIQMFVWYPSGIFGDKRGESRVRKCYPPYELVLSIERTGIPISIPEGTYNTNEDMAPIT